MLYDGGMPYSRFATTGAALDRLLICILISSTYGLLTSEANT